MNSGIRSSSRARRGTDCSRIGCRASRLVVECRTRPLLRRPWADSGAAGVLAARSRPSRRCVTIAFLPAMALAKSNVSALLPPSAWNLCIREFLSRSSSIGPNIPLAFVRASWRVVALTDPGLHGYYFAAVIGLRIAPAHAESAATNLFRSTRASVPVRLGVFPKATPLWGGPLPG